MVAQLCSSCHEVSRNGVAKVTTDVTVHQVNALSSGIQVAFEDTSFDSALACLAEAHSRELRILKERIQSQALELESHKNGCTPSLTPFQEEDVISPRTPSENGYQRRSPRDAKAASSGEMKKKDYPKDDVDTASAVEINDRLLGSMDMGSNRISSLDGILEVVVGRQSCSNTGRDTSATFAPEGKESVYSASKGSTYCPPKRSDVMRAAARARLSQASTHSVESDMSIADDCDVTSAVSNWQRFVENSFMLAKQCWVAPRQEWKRNSGYIKAHIKELGGDPMMPTLSSNMHDFATRNRRGHRANSITYHVKQILHQRVSCAHLIVEPYSPKRLWWIFFGVLLILYDAIAMPMQAFGEAEHVLVDIIDWTLQIYWTIDIAVCFMTGVYVHSDLEMRPKEVAKIYARTWLGLDLLVTLPAWVVLFIRGEDGDNNTRSLKLAKFMRVLRFIRLLRILKIDKLLNETLDSINSSALLLAIGVMKLVFALAFICHISACFFFFVGSSQQGSRKGWAHGKIISGASTLYEYLSAAHWAITQFQGTSDVLPGSTLAERAYAVSAVLIALVLLASFVSSLTNMMMNFQSTFKQLTYRNDVVRGYLRSNSVPSQLAIQIKKYIAWKHRLDYIQEFDVAMPSMLPSSLWMDVLFNVRTPALCTYRYFQSITLHFPRLIRKLCFEAVEQLWPHPAEVLFSCNDEGARMYFVTEGKVQYTIAQCNGKDKHLARSLISKGMYLSEGALWTMWIHLGECKALDTLNASSKVLALGAAKFIDIMLPCRPAHAYGVSCARRFCAVFNRFGRTYSDYIDPIEFEEAADEADYTSSTDGDVESEACDAPFTLQLGRNGNEKTNLG